MGWRRRAVLDRALRVLVACRRLATGRQRRPTAAIVDTQSVRTGPQRGPRGYDANKKIKGRKRVLMVDTQGDPLGVRVVSADVQDRDALHAPAPDLGQHASLLLAWLDRAFAGDDPAAFLRAYGIIPELAGTLGRKGFQVEPRRWKVERTFACLQRYRRLRVDDEMSPDTSRQMTVLAAVFMIGMRPPAAHAPVVRISGRL
jgi:transposase